MQRAIRIFTLLALMVLGAGQARAEAPTYDIKQGTVTGGTLYFCSTYENGLLDNKITDGKAAAGQTVYIRAVPDFGNTVRGGVTDDGIATFITIEKTTGSGAAEARSMGAPPVGSEVTVTQVVPGIYQFTMPTSGMNVTVSASFPVSTPVDVDYLDATGATKTAQAYVLDGAEYRLGKYVDTGSYTESALDTNGKPYETWYVVNSNVAYNEGLTLYGDVHLILTDGKTMTVSNKVNDAIGCATNGYTYLTIYGQSGGTGSLTATTTDDTTDGSGINVLRVTINGGKVTATGKLYGIYASGCTDGVEKGLIINGGEVTARTTSTDFDHAALFSGYTIDINGGQVTATCDGESDAYGIYAQGDIILGWKNATDFIKATNYYGPVKTASGKAFIAYTPAATANDPEKQAVLIQGKTGGVELSAVTIDAIAGKVLRPATDGAALAVNYLDAEGTEKNTVTDADTNNDIVYVLQGTEGSLGEEGKTTWYVAQDEISYSSLYPLHLNGDVHLILADGAKMNVETDNGGAIILDSNTIDGAGIGLTIYGQSTGKNIGSLYASTSNSDAIYVINARGPASITINGGKVTAKTSETGSTHAISVSANTSGAGYNATFTINGGQVSATVGSNGYGIAIEGYNSTVTINGGQVTATRGTGTNDYGIYASAIENANIILGWKNATDFIQASSYRASGYEGHGTVKTASGKAFINPDQWADGATTGSVYTGTLSSTDLTAIAGMTLIPAVHFTTGGGKYIGMCRLDGDWKLPEGVKAYVVTGYDTTTGTVTLSTAPLEGLPKGVPVILMKDTDGDGLPDGNLDNSIYLIGTHSDEAADIEDSVPTDDISPLFTVGDGSLTMAELIAAATGSTDTSDYLVFVLSNGMFKVVSFSDSSVPAVGICFLIVSKIDVLMMVHGLTPPTGNARPHTIPIDLGDDATGIRSMDNGEWIMDNGEWIMDNGEWKMDNGQWYDLQGRRLSGQPTRKGVYVRGGRAVVVK